MKTLACGLFGICLAMISALMILIAVIIGVVGLIEGSYNDTIISMGIIALMIPVFYGGSCLLAKGIKGV